MQAIHRIRITSSRGLQQSMQRSNVIVSSTSQLQSPSVHFIRWHGGGPGADAPTITVSFRLADDSIKTVDARIGESLLQTAHRHDVDLEGACEGVCACSTCHLIFPASIYDQLPEPSEDEEDMLDMAFGLTETSRLGCQVIVTPEMENAVLELPKATRNFYVDGHVPKPH
ncbi:ferredoxin-2, mitochondrial [Mayamaea pseudoterrestris]|nr:ferredoxin-2, mitochondrial [Mayamaea pseudoterrestris]